MWGCLAGGPSPWPTRADPHLPVPQQQLRRMCKHSALP